MLINVKYASASILLFLFSLFTIAENTNITTSHFSGSGNCAMCHDGLTDTAGEDASIVKDWGNSMMANVLKIHSGRRKWPLNWSVIHIFRQ
jgi:hypothetical protein